MPGTTTYVQNATFQSTCIETKVCSLDHKQKRNLRDDVTGFELQKWESRLSLLLNVAKNRHYVKKKGLNKSCSKLNFVQKKSASAYVYLPRSGARGVERFPSLKNNNIQKWESRFKYGARCCQKYVASFLYEIQFRTTFI